MRILESNSKKQVPPHWNRKPKSQQEKKEFGKSKEEGVPVRGKRKPRNLGDSYDDKQIDSNFKKQNQSKKPSRDTIRKGEEDEQSVLKTMKKNGGKATFDGPEVKQRKHFAPATKVEKPKKGKGSYNRKAEEDEEHPTVPLRKNNSKNNDLGEVPMKPDHWNKKKKTGMFKKVGNKIKDKVGGLVNKSVSGGKKIEENTSIEKFIESILTKNYAAADKYIKQAVECKLQNKIEQELSTPLF
jgi:hypothetical protein